MNWNPPRTPAEPLLLEPQASSDCQNSAILPIGEIEKLAPTAERPHYPNYTH